MSEALEKMVVSTARRFKSYPKYKDSGVEWLGNVPADWSVRRADHFLRYDKVQVDPEIFKSDIVFHYSIPSIQETGDGAYENASEIDSAKLLIKGRRLLISKLNPRKGVVLIAKEHDAPTVCSSEFISLEPKDCDLGFSFYLYASYTTRERLSAVVQSATRSHQRATPEDITKMWHALPTPKEQRAIADFLDRETAKIDTLVAKKKRLIELLHEKRTALITRAVTKGLDPNVHMKESRVEWLGKIPASWKAMKIKRLCLVKRGASPRPIDDPIYFDDEGEYSWVRISDVTASNKYLLQTEQRLSFLGKSKSVPLEPGDLFVSIAATVGKPIVTKIKCCIHDGFVYFVSLKENKEYLYYLFSTGEPYKGLGKLGTQLNLNTDTIGDIIIPIPPSAEQESIVRYLDEKTVQFDALIAKISEGIERLKEHRTALISAAVTGKIDVREIA